MSAGDARSRAVEAADRLVAALEAYATASASESAAAVVAAQAREVERALGSVATAHQVAQVRHAVGSCLQAMAVRRRPRRADGARMVDIRPEVVGRADAGDIARVRAALDAALAPFDQQGELAAAEGKLGELEGAYADALARLERAVRASDVAAIVGLRTKVEVGLPGEIGQARIDLLALRLARAQVEAEPTARRVADAVERVDAAEAAVGVLEAQLAAARETLGRAVTRRNAVEGAHRQQLADQQALRGEHKALVDGHERDQQQRLRRLAGLPEPVEEAPQRADPRERVVRLETRSGNVTVTTSRVG